MAWKLGFPPVFEERRNLDGISPAWLDRHSHFDRRVRRWSGLGLMTGVSLDRQVAVVRRALDAGINWFDTAATYRRRPVGAEPRDRFRKYWPTCGSAYRDEGAADARAPRRYRNARAEIVRGKSAAARRSSTSRCCSYTIRSHRHVATSRRRSRRTMSSDRVACWKRSSGCEAKGWSSILG